MEADEVIHVLEVAKLGPLNDPDSDAFDHSEHFVSVIDMNDGARYTLCIIRIEGS